MYDRAKDDLASSRWRDRALVLLPVGACLALNLALFAAIAVRRSAYLDDYRLNDNPDAIHYVLLGHNLWLHGAFSRSAAPPWRPDMLRTPVYPVIAGALDLVAGCSSLYLAQAALHTASCALLFSLTMRACGRLSAVTASLLLATDLVFVVSNFEAMSETTCAFLVLAGIISCVHAVSGRTTRVGNIRWAVTAGLCLGAAILTRPVVLYLPPLVAGAMFISRAPVTATSQRLRAAALMIVVCYLPAAAWVTRNYHLFSVARLSNVDVGNLVYFVGAGAYQVERGMALEEAQAAIADEFHIEPYRVVQNDFAAARSVAEMDAELQAVKWRVLAAYPRSLALSTCFGIAKSLVSHNVGALGRLVGATWMAPGMADLLRMRGKAIDLLLSNEPWLVAAFAWEMLQISASITLGLLGTALTLLASRRRAEVVIPLVSMIYFVIMIAPFGLEAYSRCRLPMQPYLYLFAGCALSRLASAFAPPTSSREGGSLKS